MPRSTPAAYGIAAWLVLSTFGGFALAEERWPSSRLLLPCFELRLDGSPSHSSGLTTLFAVVNAGDEPVPVRLTVLSNWGVEVAELTSELTIEPRAVRSVNLADWILEGRLPDRTLSPNELAHVQAALCGERSPVDGRFHGTLERLADPLRAVGSVVVESLPTEGAPPDVLWGDFFIVATGDDFAQGEVLANLDRQVDLDDADEDDLCPIHALRFLEGGGFDGGTELMLWNARQGAPNEQPFFPGEEVPALLTAYDEAGTRVASLAVDLLPLQWLRVGELGLPVRFGWLEIDTFDIETFIMVRYSAADRFSLGMEAFCLPTKTAVGRGIDLEKRTNGYDADRPTGPRLPPGSPVSWTYVVTNTGQEPLHGVTVTDDRGVAVSCPSSTLAAGETMECSASALAEPCQYRNVGRVVATTAAGTEVDDTDPSHYFGEGDAGLLFEKATNGHDADQPSGPRIPVGAPVTWTYRVTNTGEVTLGRIRVTDDQGVAVRCPGARLLPGETMTCTAEGLAAEGPYRNVGRVEASTPCGTRLRLTDPSHYHGSVPDAPGIAIEKATNGHDADLPPGPSIPVGAPVAWTYVVTNTGNVPLTGVTVTDDRGVAVACPATTLAPGDGMTCSAEGTALPGPYANLGTATGTPPSGAAVHAADPSHYFGAAAGVDLEKATNGHDADLPPGPSIPAGEPVRWTYAVTNTGNVPLTGVTVTDDRGVAVTCPETSLAPGGSMTCHADGTALPGPYANLGTVAGTPPGGATVGDTDPSHYFGVCGETDIALTKSVKDRHGRWRHVDSCDGPIPDLQDRTVRWRFVVHNPSAVTLYDVEIFDDDFGGLVCTAPQLAPGATWGRNGECTRVGTVDDLKCHCRCNVASASAEDACGNAVGATDRSCYLK